MHFHAAVHCTNLVFEIKKKRRPRRLFHQSIGPTHIANQSIRPNL
jgi:hypothetical protein